MSSEIKTAALRVSVTGIFVLGMVALIWWGGIWYITGVMMMRFAIDLVEWMKAGTDAMMRATQEETD